ncbi:MAG TPA: glycerol-3-phosphate 1-O-acyltransferase PlsY [Burkholderiaceae bacterium]|nr:glycerol-3-phosphate 1-O-acyltransferase PlsY [Burkholderiaceae bacterium]
MLFALVAVLMAYLIGSISFAIVFSKLFRLSDPRTYGSGNPGATNVLRSGNKAAAILTLIFDALKGWLPVFIAQRYALEFGFSDVAIASIALAAFLGHLYPLYHRFRGGKGVATALGVLLGVHVQLALATIATFAIVLIFFRYVSFASMVGAVFAMFWYVFVWRLDAIALAIAVMALLLIWRHRANISRLMAGTESRLGSKSKTS